LQTLKERETTVATLLKENQQKSEELNNQIAHHQQIIQDLEKQKKKILQEARQTAASMIQEANQKIEQTIREIKEKQADKDITKKLRKELEKEFLLPAKEDKKLQKEKKLYVEQTNDSIEPGDTVKIISTDSLATVMEVSGNRLILALGDLKTVAKTSDVVKVEKKESGKSTKQLLDLNRIASISCEINLMGSRVEQAIQELDKYMDDVLLAGLPWIRITHGKGTGALRKAIREHLRNYKQVHSCEDAPPEQGGAGVTICKLKY
ncbi:MAG: Smr/MutS family protein, partial [Bacteroidia bacterium]|nr:Smr/MutS family protein [Bacteroidia bacterium]